MSRDKETLLHIKHAGLLIQDFIEDMREDAFMVDMKTRSAVLHQLLVIGEAVKRLSKSLREQHTEIPWSLIAGMRDHLIHAYDTVDIDEVWNTASQNIPDLLQQLEKIIIAD